MTIKTPAAELVLCEGGMSMGVYIKNMEMPKNCGECLLAKLSPTGESLICNYMLSRVSWEERPFDCPLVPVPPHGRLIDADALRTLYEKWHSEEQLGVDIDACHVPIPVIRQNIDDAPTIIPASFENLPKNERYSQDNPAEEGE